MNATMFPTNIPPDVLREVQDVIAMLQSGVRDHEAMRAAGERLDRFREADRIKFGGKDFAVQAIREAREDS